MPQERRQGSGTEGRNWVWNHASGMGHGPTNTIPDWESKILMCIKDFRLPMALVCLVQKRALVALATTGQKSHLAVKTMEEKMSNLLWALYSNGWTVWSRRTAVVDFSVQFFTHTIVNEIFFRRGTISWSLLDNAQELKYKAGKYLSPQWCTFFFLFIGFCISSWHAG